MKNFNSNRKNVGATSIASKACAWILSIMLVVTGISPGFAANNKPVNAKAAGTAASKNTAIAKTEDKNVNRRNSGKVKKRKKDPSVRRISTRKARAVKKDMATKAESAVSDMFSACNNIKSAHNAAQDKINQNNPSNCNTNAPGNNTKSTINNSLKSKVVQSLADKSKFLTSKEIKKIRRKRDIDKKGRKDSRAKKTFWLNSGNVQNVKAIVDTFVQNGNKRRVISVSANNHSYDMTIDRDKWNQMAVASGAQLDPGNDLYWETKDNYKVRIEFITDGICLPSDCTSLFQRVSDGVYGLRNVDTSKVINMNTMFFQTKSVDNDITKFNTKNVISMNRTFALCDGLDFRNNEPRWDVSKVTDMEMMFYKTPARGSVGKDWDTSKVTNMKEMFYGAYLIFPEVEKWDVSKVTDTSGMFSGSAIYIANLSKWNLRSLSGHNYDKCKNMFVDCKNLRELVTPEGLKTDINAVGENIFEIVELKKGSPARIREKAFNSSNSYILNINANREVCYHVFDTRYCCGITFDSNNGDTEAWKNHLIHIKGENTWSYHNFYPEIDPKLQGSVFRGWSKNANAIKPDFDRNEKISTDTTLYAVYKQVEFRLNASGNVMAKLDLKAEKLVVTVKNTSGDMRIDREKWKYMVKSLGGRVDSDGDPDWNGVEDVKNIDIPIRGIRLPGNSRYLFLNFGGEIKGCENLIMSDVYNMRGLFWGASLANPNVSNWDTSKVTDMSYMFFGATKADPNISKWNVSNVTGMESMFYGSGISKVDLSNWKLKGGCTTGEMFKDCKGLKWLKTPVGLNTTVSGTNANFKITKLKKGSPASVENESKSLSNTYTINSSSDKNTAYNIYRKDTYAGVTFDKNGGNDDAWRNHEIVEKNKSISASGGNLPAENPKKANHAFIGWATQKSATSSNFTANTVVSQDTAVYAVYKRGKLSLNASGNVYAYLLNSTGDLIILTESTSGDMKIDREKWKDMVKLLGGEVDSVGDPNWDNVDSVKNISIGSTVNSGIRLPGNSGYLFFNFKGEVKGCEHLITSDVYSMQGLFWGATKADPYVSGWDTSKVTDMGFMFRGAINADPGVSSWDTSKVTNMHAMFSITKKADPNVSKWDTSTVVDMQGMFGGASKANPDVSKWDTSKVTNMDFIFYNATNADPDVSKWNVSNVTNMQGMFQGATKADPDVAKWNVSNVTTMESMFNGSGISKADLSSWKLKDGCKTDEMFKDCEGLIWLKTPMGFNGGVSGADASFKIVKLKKGSPVNVEKETQNLKEYYTINAAGGKDVMYHIYRKDKYVGVTFDKNGGDSEAWINHEIVEKGTSISKSGGNLPAENPTRKGLMFRGWAESSDAKVPIFNSDLAIRSDIKVYAVWNNGIYEFSLNASGNVNAKLGTNKSLDISAVDISGDMNIDREKWIDMVKSLGGNYENGGLVWDRTLGKHPFVTNIDFRSRGIYLPSDSSSFFYLFPGNIYGCGNLKTDKVTNMDAMFTAAFLANPDVSNWDTSKVTSMNTMFGMTSANPDVSKWDTSKVTNVSGMFSFTTNANPNVSKWDVSNVTNMGGMFSFSNITKMDLSKWKLNSKILTDLYNSNEMFRACSKLEYLKTPVGLTNSVSTADADFKIVKLKKGSPVNVEKETQNLKEDYKINAAEDKKVMYHIYRKDKYAGVTFDKNSGNSEAWINHEIVEKGKRFKEGGGNFPAEMPKKAEHAFLGWATQKNATSSNFAANTEVSQDTTVYAVYKKLGYIPLNESGNVYAKLDSNNDLIITAKNASGDMKIDREKWKDMVKLLGGEVDNDGDPNWNGVENVKNINITNSGIRLPENSRYLFWYFKGEIKGCANLITSDVYSMRGLFAHALSANPYVSNWDTSKVTNMEYMFSGATKADPNVSKWDVSNVTTMDWMFMYSGISQADLSNWKPKDECVTNMMFKDCEDLKWLKTPVGLNTTVRGADADFKIVKLKKGSPVNVEKETQNLKEYYTINADSDKDVMYNIYRKDEYVGVTFDKNGGNSEAWINHEIVQHGKSIKESGGTLPEEEPGKDQHRFKGWDKSETASGSGSFTENTVVNEDTKVYAVYEKEAPTPGKVNVIFDSNGGTGMMAPKQVDKDSEYTLPVCSFTAPAGKEFDKWLVTVGSGLSIERAPGESVLASDNMTVKAMWRSVPAPGKVNIVFNANGGAGSMPAKQIDKDSDYTLPVCGYTAPAGKKFDKWEVTIGTAAAVNKNPGESVIASDNVTVKAMWKENVTPPVPSKVNVTFDPNGGTGMMAPKQVDKDSDYTLPVCSFTAPAGKEFDKWLVTVGSGLSIERAPGESVLASDNMTIKAMWRSVPTPGKVNVRFNANGGSGSMPTQQVDKNSNYKLPACGYTAPAGKEFDKWEVTVGSGAAVNKAAGDAIVAGDNVTVKALWKENVTPPPTPGKVNVIFDPNGGTGMMAPKQVDKDSDYTLPVCSFTAPTGKEFDKWLVTVGSGLSIERAPGESVLASDNMTVKAMWRSVSTPGKVNIRFNANGGSGSMPTQQVDKNSSYKLPACGYTAPTGKEFDKWEVTVGSGAAENKNPGESVIAGDNVTVKALWKESVTPPPVNVSVILDGNGGVLAGGFEATLNVEEGSTIKAQLEAAVTNNMFTKPGYKLIGFSKSKFALAADYNVDAPVYGNFTLYAVYEEAPELTTVTIKYSDIDLGEDAKIEDVSVGKPIGAKLDGNARDRDGYRFLGYSKVQNAEKPDFFKKSIVTENLVIYPVYKEATNEDKVKVAFKLNDGTDASLKTEEVTRYESLGNKMPTKDKVAERDGYLFTGWAKSKSAKYPDFFRSTVVKGDMTVYAVWKSLYNEKLGQAVLKVSAKAKGYELTITPPAANLHTGFEIFRSEKKDFKPGSDTKIATVDRNILKYLDEKADNSKVYYYAVRAIDADGSYNGTKVTFIGKLSDKVLAAPLPKDKGVTATVEGKGKVNLEFNKTIAAAGYKVTVTAPYDKKFKTIERFVEADKLVVAGAGKVKASITGLSMGKFLAFKLEALEADNTKLVEYGNSFAFMLGAVEKLSAKVNKKNRVLNIKFKAMKGVSGYEAKIVINGKVKTIKLKKGKKKLRGFIVGSIRLPKKKGNYRFTIRAFKKIGKLKYFGQTITKVVK